MRNFMSILLVGAVITTISACGGGSSDSAPPATPVSFLGTTNTFVAWADPTSGTYSAATTGSYAGKRQILRGTIDFMTGTNLSQAVGIEIYKGDDGHVYALDLMSTMPPAAQQLSSESMTTTDDTCTLSGTAISGANYDYVGVYFSADLQTTTNSSYFYRLPGPDGVCNTADDVVHMVKSGMTAATAPIVATRMPVATVRTAAGGISGFVVKSGATLELVDSNFANPVALGTFAAPIGVAVALPVGTNQGYPSGQLYVVDGHIVYVNYVAHTVSASLYTIPNWIATNPEALFAAAPSTLYFSINTAAAGSTPAVATIYAMPADGSAAPGVIDSEAGRVATLLVPVQGSNLLFGIVNPNYTIRTVAIAGGPAATLVSSSENAGTFIATATTVYYEIWNASTDTTTLTVTHSGTQSGIVAVDGIVVQSPLANSTFVDGGEQLAWPADTTTTSTPYETVFQVTALSPVTVTNTTTGYTYIEDGVSGGTLTAIDTSSNQVGAIIGVLPASSATTLSGTYRDSGHTGFLDAANAVSTGNPMTRDLYLLNSQTANSLVRATGNL
jgi:hypothetical protein